MKLLGVRIDEHDTNLSYYNNGVVHYLKTERKFNVKHHHFSSIAEIEHLIWDEWCLSFKDITELAIVIDAWHHGFSLEHENFFPSIENFDLGIPCKTTRVNHHYAHQLSCWTNTKRANNNGIVIDGFGDWDNAWTVFKNGKIIEKGSVEKHGSIGQRMAMLKDVYNLQGSLVDAAGKLMALQSYGKIDRYLLNEIKKYDIYDVRTVFKILHEDNKLDSLKTIHHHIGYVILNLFKKHFKTNEAICYSGGVALNVNWNTLLKNYFPNIIIPPHANDEGLSLGALEYLRLKYKLPFLKLKNFPYCQSDVKPKTNPSKKLIKKVSELLKNQKIIGWYQGNGEIGPRALGNRSILADPRSKDMKNKINKIKKREYFRPFGCSTLDKSFNDSEYMLYADPINPFIYPAVSHIDSTCRHQTVIKESHFKKLLKSFYNITNCNTLLNTSLNNNGNPLCSNFYQCFNLLQESELDGLVFGNELYLKND